MIRMRWALIHLLMMTQVEIQEEKMIELSLSLSSILRGVMETIWATEPESDDLPVTEDRRSLVATASRDRFYLSRVGVFRKPKFMRRITTIVGICTMRTLTPLPQ